MKSHWKVRYFVVYCIFHDFTFFFFLTSIGSQAGLRSFCSSTMGTAKKGLILCPNLHFLLLTPGPGHRGSSRSSTSSSSSWGIPRRLFMSNISDGIYNINFSFLVGGARWMDYEFLTFPRNTLQQTEVSLTQLHIPYNMLYGIFHKRLDRRRVSFKMQHTCKSAIKVRYVSVLNTYERRTVCLYAVMFRCFHFRMSIVFSKSSLKYRSNTFNESGPKS